MNELMRILEETWVDIPNKRVTVTHTLDPDALEDALDAMGLLLG